MNSIAEQLFHRPAEAWNRFWFSPTTAHGVTRVRAAVCLVTALWLYSFIGIANVALWFGDEGLLNRSMSARLIEFEETPSWQHWSPLWWTSSVFAHQAWLVGGIVLSLLAAWGVGGRGILIALLVMTVGWIHRITWLQGAVEPALVAMLGYLVIAPGERLFAKRGGASTTSWLNGAATRLIQTHCWILLAAGLLMQLASIVWWRGEAVWWLAASGHSHLLSTEFLRNRPVLVNGLTHSMIAIQMLALWLLVIPTMRLWGMLAGVLAALSIGLIGDQLLYGLLLSGCLLAWSQPKLAPQA